ncbi:MAG: hypothetical protein Hyperionvirus52_1, partial [Hyperionvirus sp.]
MVYENLDKKYISLKYVYSKLKLSDEHDHILNDAIERTDKIIKQSCLFIRSYHLYQFQKGEDLLYITNHVIDVVIQCITKKAIAGPTRKRVSPLKQKLLNYYEKHFAELTLNFAQYHAVDSPLDYEFFKINKTNLTQILHYAQTEIVTNIENNIKLHFLDYIRRFVNESFKEENDKALEQFQKKMRVIERKRMTAQL